jgi:acetyl esterase/lipase
VRRRTVLALPALGLVGAALTACREDAPVSETTAEPRRFAYGDDPSQFGELYLPRGRARGVVVVIHGGFWRAAYDLTLGAPLAASLAAEGWAAWNLEYRRVGAGPGGGGGVPQTLDDVAAGLDRLRDLDLDLATVLTLGHSAGGHLAAWAASRGRSERWRGGVDVTGVVAQAGVLDLRAAHDAGLGGGATEAFVGHPPTAADAAVDPAQQVPLDVPLVCVHGRDDTIVPPSQSEGYVARATAAGAVSRLVAVDGDHFTVIDPDSAAWARTLDVLADLAGPADPA